MQQEHRYPFNAAQGYGRIHLYTVGRKLAAIPSDAATGPVPAMQKKRERAGQVPALVSFQCVVHVATASVMEARPCKQLGSTSGAGSSRGCSSRNAKNTNRNAKNTKVDHRFTQQAVLSKLWLARDVKS
jgi:hypothetical protein